MRRHEKRWSLAHVRLLRQALEQEEGVLYYVGCSEGFLEEVAFELGVTGCLGLHQHREQPLQRPGHV